MKHSWHRYVGIRRLALNKGTFGLFLIYMVSQFSNWIWWGISTRKMQSTLTTGKSSILTMLLVLGIARDLSSSRQHSFIDRRWDLSQHNECPQFCNNVEGITYSGFLFSLPFLPFWVITMALWSSCLRIGLGVVRGINSLTCITTLHFFPSTINISADIFTNEPCSDIWNNT